MHCPIIEHISAPLARAFRNASGGQQMLIILHQVLLNQAELLRRTAPQPVTQLIFQPLEVIAMDLSLGLSQFEDLAVLPKDKNGNLTVEPAALTFTSSDEGIATAALAPADIVVEAPKIAMRVTSGTKPGTATITVSDGTVSGTLTVTVAPPPPEPVASLDFEVIDAPQG